MSQQANLDPFEIRKLYRYLRVVDVVDAMDGMGYFNIGLMAPEIRPLWLGMKFWGPALTLRCVPANRPMWPLKPDDPATSAHAMWFKEVGNVKYADSIQPGHVIVTDTGGSGEVGYWGSNNAMGIIARGAVGIVTDGYCRDTAEVALQKTPICCRARGRTIIPGRIETVEAQVRVGCGGAQVRPGDIVGCDDDGVVVVPIEIAAEVAKSARAILLHDMQGRRNLYAKLGLPFDETVDFEAVEAYYRQFE
ncbi:MAG: 4-hydroxy-4-methyl-2-oxoglutarate aldolase [candidate division BRC1 bacterium ADurb.BinA364]|nr:MAG: 4-hydroxy-4-methyl-2-oxoglutarate aldolase [candidate division BRC1 bacterium ADurb.BinA364]